MEKPAILGESGILFVSKVYCLHASNTSTHNENWSWVVNASITLKNGEPPKVSRLARLVKIFDQRTDVLGISEVCFCNSGMLKKLKLKYSDLNSHSSNVNTPDMVCEKIGSSIGDALKKARRITVGLGWEKVLSRKGVSFSDLVRAAVAISGYNTIDSLRAVDVTSVFDSAIQILDKKEDYRWFSRLYGDIKNLFCAIMFTSHVNKSSENDEENVTYLPVLFTNEGVVAIFGRMENAVNFVSTLNREDEDRRKQGGYTKSLSLVNKKSYRLNIMMPDLKLFSKALSVIEMVNQRCKRSCPAERKMYFSSTIRGGFPTRVCYFIEHIFVPIAKYTAVVMFIIGVLKIDKVFERVGNLLRNNPIAYYFQEQLTTGAVVSITRLAGISFFVWFVIKSVKKYLETTEAIRVGNIKPGVWEYFILPFEKEKNTDWLA